MPQKKQVPKDHVWGLKLVQRLIQARQACRRRRKELTNKTQAAKFDRVHAWALSDPCIELILDHMSSVNQIQRNMLRATSGSILHYSLFIELRSAMLLFITETRALQDNLRCDKPLSTGRIRDMSRRMGF